MTFDEFFNELKCLRLHWVIKRGRAIRCHRRMPMSHKFVECCPLTAFIRVGDNQWKFAANFLGIDETLGRAIVDAADWCMGHEEKHTDVYKYRRKLLTLVRASKKRAKAI